MLLLLLFSFSLLLFFLIPAIHVWLNGDALHRHDGEKREREREAIVTHTHGNELRVYNTAVDLLPVIARRQPFASNLTFLFVFLGHEDDWQKAHTQI